MKRYEYKTDLMDIDGKLELHKCYLIELGRLGWRVVSVVKVGSSQYCLWVLLEREVT